MNPKAIFASASSGQDHSRKWRIGGVLSLEVSPALLGLTIRSKTSPFPLRPPVAKAALFPRIAS
jgi:hypothetical protein